MEFGPELVSKLQGRHFEICVAEYPKLRCPLDAGRERHCVQLLLWMSTSGQAIPIADSRDLFSRLNLVQNCENRRLPMRAVWLVKCSQS